MSERLWQVVLARGCAVPPERPLSDLTAELTTMLGDPNPEVRDGIAMPVLTTWIQQGVYDDLLAGLGDGMAAGLIQGLGEADTDSVFRRSYSAVVLAECIRRDNEHGLVPPNTMLSWGDAVAAWVLREKDFRGYIPSKGWAHAIAHAADALGAIAECLYFGQNELTVLLDVIADRVVAPVSSLWQDGEVDRLAMAARAILTRDVVPITVVKPWLARLVQQAGAVDYATNASPFLQTGHSERFLRALFLQVEFDPKLPQRSELLPVLKEAVRAANPYVLPLEE